MNATDDIKTYRGRTLEEVLPKIKAELGPEAVIVRQRDGLTGGVGGFFQRQCIEVDARPAERRFDAYDEDPAAAPQRPAPASQDEDRGEDTSRFVPDPLVADQATAEGLGSPAIQEMLRQAAPFADHLSAAAERGEIEAPSPAPEPAYEPQPVREQPLA